MRILMSALLGVVLLSRAAMAQECAPSLEIIGWPGPEKSAGVLTLSDFEGGQVLLTQADVAHSEWIMHWNDQPAVLIRFTEKGQAVFASHTAGHLGEPVAIVYERKLLTAPVIQSQITGGEAVVTGDFTVEEAAEMARRLTSNTCPPDAGS